MKSVILTIILVSSYVHVWGQHIWINEIHYDNAGTDSTEFVEVVASGIVSQAFIHLYNGINGTPYDSVLLDTLNWKNTAEGFRLTAWYPESIQNGAPDGMALIVSNEIISAISYEGTFTGTAGPASGYVFSDIGIFESGLLPESWSLQKQGHGNRDEHFWWKLDHSSSPGDKNRNQEFTYLPEISVDITDTIRFGEVPYGNHSDSRKIVFSGVNISQPIEIYIPFGYELSKDVSFSTNYTAANPYRRFPVADFIPPDTVFIRFCPPQRDGQDYSSQLIFENQETSPLFIQLEGREGIPEIPNGWINEFHYDNTGTDTLEFVEVILQYPERYLEDKISLTLFNGSNLQSYRIYGLADAIPGFRDDLGFEFFTFLTPGIQNGPDAILLSYGEVFLDFISYEGVLEPWPGITSIRVLPEENGDTPPLSSIQFYGTGDTKNEFDWILVPGNHTMGLPNIDQILPVRLLTVSDLSSPPGITWQTYDDPLMAGYQVELSPDGISYDSTTFIPVHRSGTSAETYSYYYVNDQAEAYRYIRIRFLDINGNAGVLFTRKIKESPRHSIRVTWNHDTSEVYLPDNWKDQEFTAALYSIQGTLLKELHDFADSHSLRLDHWLDPLPEGVYFLRLKNPFEMYFIRIIRK